MILSSLIDWLSFYAILSLGEVGASAADSKEWQEDLAERPTSADPPES